MNAYTIREIETISGIKAHTLRVWEQRYSFFKLMRTKTNKRTFTDIELKKILNIKQLIQYGYKLAHLNKMTADEIELKVVETSSSNLELNLNYSLNKLLLYTIELRIIDFENLVSKLILEKGIDKTYVEILIPYFNKIGILWQTNKLSIATEHIFSNIIRNKLIHCIENIKKQKQQPSNIKIAFFLPSNEIHEIGLLFCYYLATKEGLETFYLGSDMPIKEAISFCKNNKICHLVTFINTNSCQSKIEKSSSVLKDELKESILYINGNIEMLKLKMISNNNIQFITNINQLRFVINKLTYSI